MSLVQSLDMYSRFVAPLFVSAILFGGCAGDSKPHLLEQAMSSERHEFDEEAEEFVGDIMSEIYSRSRDLSDREEVVYHISWMMTEINNGGLHQYFYNSTGDECAETLKALRLIGASSTAALIERACAEFPTGMPPADYKERRKQLEAFGPAQLAKFDEMSEQFYARSEDLHLMLKRHWESHQ